jgi:hypothetical protein
VSQYLDEKYLKNTEKCTEISGILFLPDFQGSPGQTESGIRWACKVLPGDPVTTNPGTAMGNIMEDY